MFEIVTGRAFTDSALADRASSILGIRSHIGPPPATWIDSLDDKTRDRISESSQRPLDLDRYLQLAYDQDEEQILDIADDEEVIPIEEYEKAKREFTEAELESLSHTLRKLLVNDPESRGTPETLLRSSWFEGQGIT